MMLPTIKLGSTGNIVKIAQYLLGVAPVLLSDGIFDSDFKMFIVQWQTEKGLKVDGIIGKESWNSIAAEANVCSVSRNRIHPCVCALQLLLDGLEVDGEYGQKTKKAVAAYQASKGLLIDGICGYETWNSLIVGGSTKETIQYSKPVDYKQNDSRWGKIVFTSCGNKSQTIGNSGCGPTAMADIVATLKDSRVTPPVLAELAVANGYRTKSDGTAWKFFPFIQEYYGFSKLIESTNLASLKACLDAGGYAVASMAPGYWTNVGHFICVWKYDEKYIYANDPASRKRTKQNTVDFMKERKRFFCFYP